MKNNSEICSSEPSTRSFLNLNPNRARGTTFSSLGRIISGGCLCKVQPNYHFEHPHKNGCNSHVYRHLLISSSKIQYRKQSAFVMLRWCETNGKSKPSWDYIVWEREREEKKEREIDIDKEITPYKLSRSSRQKHPTALSKEGGRFEQGPRQHLGVTNLFFISKTSSVSRISTFRGMFSSSSRLLLACKIRS